MTQKYLAGNGGGGVTKCAYLGWASSFSSSLAVAKVGALKRR